MAAWPRFISRTVNGPSSTRSYRPLHTRAVRAPMTGLPSTVRLAAQDLIDAFLHDHPVLRETLAYTLLRWLPKPELHTLLRTLNIKVWVAPPSPEVWAEQRIKTAVAKRVEVEILAGQAKQTNQTGQAVTGLRLCADVAKSSLFT